MSRGTARAYSQTYLRMLMAGPVLAHEFGAVAPGRLSNRMRNLKQTLPSGWRITSRWVRVPSKFGLRLHEKCYQLIRPVSGDVCRNNQQ